MSWSLEEMAAYVRLHESLANKSRKPKSSSSKPPSSPKAVAPVAPVSLSDVDFRIVLLANLNCLLSRLTIDLRFFLIPSLRDLMN